jgi:hypothetical protein
MKKFMPIGGLILASRDDTVAALALGLRCTE